MLHVERMLTMSGKRTISYFNTAHVNTFKNLPKANWCYSHTESHVPLRHTSVWCCSQTEWEKQHLPFLAPFYASNLICKNPQHSRKNNQAIFFFNSIKLNTVTFLSSDENKISATGFYFSFFGLFLFLHQQESDISFMYLLSPILKRMPMWEDSYMWISSH